MSKHLLKSIWAVLAGFILVFILSVGTDVIMEKANIFPAQDNPGAYLWWMLLIALIYRCIYTVIGGYVTAAFAPHHPMRHVVILGSIGFVMATLGSIANWDKAITSGIWYPIALIVLSLPSVWLGGRLKGNNRHSSPRFP